MNGFPEPGTRLDLYQLERQVGRGGFSAVYLGEDLRLGRKVAVKILDPGVATDELYRERFLADSRLAAAVDHPHVLPVYDSGYVDGFLYIVMRFVDGPDFKQVIAAQSPLDPDRVITLLAGVASALDAVHAASLVHRDVKPANILLDGGVGGAREHPYLTDFGISKPMTAAEGATAIGVFRGTADYAAPEQIEGRNVDLRADVYALACVLFEALTGRVPYAEAPSDAAHMALHLTSAAPSARALRPELPAAVDEALAQAFVKDPALRLTSCSLLVERVRVALQSPDPAPPPRIPLAYVPSPTVSLGAIVSDPSNDPAPPPPAPPPPAAAPAPPATTSLPAVAPDGTMPRSAAPPITGVPGSLPPAYPKTAYPPSSPVPVQAYQAPPAPHSAPAYPPPAAPGYVPLPAAPPPGYPPPAAPPPAASSYPSPSWVAPPTSSAPVGSQVVSGEVSQEPGSNSHDPNSRSKGRLVITGIAAVLLLLLGGVTGWIAHGSGKSIRVLAIVPTRGQDLVNLLRSPASTMEEGPLLWQAGDSSVSLELTAAGGAVDGTQSLQAKSTKEQFGIITSDHMSVVSGQRYVALGFVKSGGDPSAVSMSIRWFDRSDTPLTDNNSPGIFEEDGAFSLLGVTATAPPGAFSASLIVNFRQKTPGDPQFLDHVLLSQVAQA